MAGMISGLRRLFARRAPTGPTPAPQSYFFLGEGLGLSRLRRGDLIYVDPREESVCSHLIAHGVWETWVEQTLMGLIRPGDHVIEVGAHVGYYSLAMARAVGPTGRVTSFEANPRLASLASSSLMLNGLSGHAAVLNKAVSDAPQTVRFSTSRREAGGGHLFVEGTFFRGDMEVFEIEAVRLDDLDLPPPRLMRIDAEGSEALILAGAARLLARSDIILVIEWDVIQLGYRSDVSAFAAWLDDLGFRFWRIRHDGGRDPVATAELANIPACDLIVSRQDPFAIEA
jgi:FkbM family methyltransferase